MSVSGGGAQSTVQIDWRVMDILGAGNQYLPVWYETVPVASPGGRWLSMFPFTIAEVMVAMLAAVPPGETVTLNFQHNNGLGTYETVILDSTYAPGSIVTRPQSLTLPSASQLSVNVITSAGIISTGILLASALLRVVP
jgi:hypothetical protein